MLTTAQMTAVRAAQAQTFDLTATIRRRTVSQDATTKRVSETTSAVGTMPCRLAPGKASDRERIEAGRVVSGTIWRITGAAETDVRLNDQLTIGSRTFEVIAVWGAESRETARVCLCVER
jgi:hypothetical protein